MTYNTIQKQPPQVLYKNRCSYIFRNSHRKTLEFESLFNKVAGLQATLLKGDFNPVVFCEYCEIFKNTYFKGNAQFVQKATFGP